MRTQVVGRVVGKVEPEVLSETDQEPNAVKSMLAAPLMHERDAEVAPRSVLNLLPRH